MTASTNLTKRGSTYQFVLRVPKGLVGDIGKARLQFSLGTENEIEARRKALPYAEEWEKRFTGVASASWSLRRSGRRLCLLSGRWEPRL